MSFLSVYFVAGFTPVKLIDDYLKAMQAATEMNKRFWVKCRPGAVQQS